jgi:tRNA(Ile)-lysidine synthase
LTSKLHQRILATIRQQDLIRPGDRIGAAVSGGADSVALLCLLEELRARLGITLCVLHFNHQLRGTQSDADEKFVKSLAKSRGLEFFTASEDVASKAKRNAWNLEDAGRRMRYEYFARMAREGRITKAATAHTADDQAETVLARIIRGTGMAGLAAIYPQFGPVVRPLLEVRRESLRKYLRTRGQEWREDRSNRDQRRFRARLRHQLLPALEDNFSPAIVEKLCNLGELARSEESFWNVLVQDRFDKLADKYTDGFSIHARDILRPLPLAHEVDPATPNPMLALTQRLVRRFHADAAEAEGQLSRRHVEQVIQFAAKGHSGRHLELPGGVRVVREFDRVVFRARKTAGRAKANVKILPQSRAYEYEVRLPAAGSTTIAIPELGRSLCLKLIDWPKQERDTRCQEGVLDAERLSDPLLIRNWKPGDAYRPCGRRKARKLKRMFTEGRVAAAERVVWPVLTSAGKVAWADKMPPAAEFSANETTRIGLWIGKGE